VHTEELVDLVTSEQPVTLRRGDHQSGAQLNLSQKLVVLQRHL